MEKTVTDIKEATLIYWNSNNELLLAVGGLLVIILIICLALRKGKATEGKMSKREEYKLNRRQTRIRQKTLIADGIGDVLLDLFAKGEIDQEAYERWTLRCGRRLNIVDLLPKKPTIKQMKDSVKRRRASGFYQKIVPVPTVKETKKKTVIDNILAA